MQWLRKSALVTAAPWAAPRVAATHLGPHVKKDLHCYGTRECFHARRIHHQWPAWHLRNGIHSLRLQGICPAKIASEEK